VPFLVQETPAGKAIGALPRVGIGRESARDGAGERLLRTLTAFSHGELPFAPKRVRQGTEPQGRRGPLELSTRIESPSDFFHFRYLSESCARR